MCPFLAELLPLAPDVLYHYGYPLTRNKTVMTGNIVAGKNYGGYKYGRIAEKSPNLTRHYFTCKCNINFTKKVVNPPNFTCHIAKFGSIQESRPTRGSFRGSFYGSFCGNFRGSFCEFPRKFLRKFLQASSTIFMNYFFAYIIKSLYSLYFRFWLVQS